MFLSFAKQFLRGFVQGMQTVFMTWKIAEYRFLRTDRGCHFDHDYINHIIALQTV
jgi:hypothetical protein